jgi:uncharacterized protein YndB with AHSA1/START domain
MQTEPPNACPGEGLAGLQSTILDRQPGPSSGPFGEFIQGKEVVTAPEDVLVITRLFDAPPACVFDAWMSREGWQSWIGPEGVHCDVSLLEPHVGGRYRLEMHLPGGGGILVGGIFKIVDRPRTLSFTWGADGDPTRQSIITLTFTEAAKGTELRLRQEGLGSASNRDAHRHGWIGALNKLQHHLAKKEPP